jgi:hypothetical protein
MSRVREMCFSLFVVAIIGLTAEPVCAEPPERLKARIEFVSAADSYAYQSTTSQLIEALEGEDSDRPAQLLANTSAGMGFLYFSLLGDTPASTEPDSFWQGLAGRIDPQRAARADGFVTTYREMLLTYRADLSYRPSSPRATQQDRRYLAFFIYGVPTEQRTVFEAMSEDYNQLCKERGVRLWSETYEIAGDGEELRFLIVKASVGAPDFWRSEAELDAAIQGERFERIGLQAEAMISSVEFLSAIPMSQRLAQSPLLRD